MWENDHVTRDILVVMKMGWRHQSDFNDNRVGKWGFDSMKMVEFFLSFQTKKGDVGVAKIAILESFLFKRHSSGIAFFESSPWHFQVTAHQV